MAKRTEVETVSEVLAELGKCPVCEEDLRINKIERDATTIGECVRCETKWKFKVLIEEV